MLAKLHSFLSNPAHLFAWLFGIASAMTAEHWGIAIAAVCTIATAISNCWRNRQLVIAARKSGVSANVTDFET
ncbi:MAG: hypothetical protein ACOH2G_08525 [Ewingella sp.]